MSLKLICRGGHYATHGDQPERSEATSLGADQGVFGRDIGEIKQTPEKTFDKAAFLTRIAKLHTSIPMTAPVVAAMRQEERY
jgi:hypothetical protein